MYAAAAARQCEASRQARKKQAQEQLKNKLNQKLAKEKSVAQVKGFSTPTKSKPFHQLPASYLKAPHAHNTSGGGRKFSVNSNKLLLPDHQHSFHHQHNLPRTPTGSRELRLDVCQKLTKSATATFPLASQYLDGSPPQTPTLLYCKGQTYKHSQQNLLSSQLHIPGANDHIIITPATPLPSPHPSQHQSRQHLNQRDSENDHLVDHLSPEDDDTPLERKCSVYRNKKLGVHDESFYKSTTIKLEDSDEFNLQPAHPYFPGIPNGGHHPHWSDDYCDSEHRTLGVCTCDHVEVKFFF